jgi:hypothetical protein|uniref:Uncharacterized protein n=1 Tax=Myoviridae sp. ctNnv6 TaxID=2825091 RepID=A0A8S5P2A0_9CAUD|nr:MAG TPA: Protein of unknown function (DUF1018) [Myoviridae sp. ctNnv6]
MPPEYNYRKFYALLARMPYADKETLVYQYTKGRTEHLRQMHPEEYRMMLRDMKRVVDDDEASRELKKRRSAVLKLMQQLGIDTTRWPNVDAFCTDARIASKVFRRLSMNELEALVPRLRSILNKGGLKNSSTPMPPQPAKLKVKYNFIMNKNNNKDEKGNA